MSLAKIIHIEQLRGISILLVLFYHLQIPGFQFGYLGVDLFFVISGFLMAKIYGEIATGADILDFFSRRGARLLPAYMVVLFATTLAGIVLLLPHEIEALALQGVWSAFMLPNFGLWNDVSYFDYMLFRPLLNFWSLGVELQFYLLFPLLILVARYSRVYLAAFTLLSLLIALATSYLDPKSAFFLLPARLWEFMAGYYVATGGSRRFNLLFGGNSRLGGIALACLLALIFLAPFVEVRNSFWLILPLILFSAVAVGNGFTLGTVEGALSRCLVILGKYSYSIYLVHFPIIVFANYEPFEGTHLQIQSAPKFALVILLIALSSWLLHTQVEQRTRHRLTPRLLAMGVALACVASVLLIRPAIEAGRVKLSEPLLLIADALEDREPYQCDEAMAGDSPLQVSCRLTPPTDSETIGFLLAGNSHADTIKGGLAQVLGDHSLELRYMKQYRAVDERFDGMPIIQEALAQGSKVIVLHATLSEDQGQALARFTRVAGENKLDVIFIAPIPRYDVSVPKTMLEHYQATSQTQRTGMKKMEQERLLAVLRTNLNKFAHEYPNFSWYDPTDLYCDDYCYLSTEDGTPLYYDSNHLTLTGVELMQPIFEAIGNRYP